MPEGTDLGGLGGLILSMSRRLDEVAREVTEAGRKLTVVEEKVIGLHTELKPEGQHSAITKIALNENKIAEIERRHLDLKAKHEALLAKLEEREREALSHKRMLWVALVVAAIGVLGSLAGGIVTVIKW